MILPHVLPFQSHPASVKSSVTSVELNRVETFLRLAHVQRDGSLAKVYFRLGEPVIDSKGLAEPGLRVYKFHFAQINVRLNDGRLAFYSGSQPQENYLPSFEPDGTGGDRILPRALTDAEAAAIVSRLAA